MLIKNAQVDGQRLDVRFNEFIVEVGVDLAPGDDVVQHAQACALLPGLHDHHLHFFAGAAARRSVDLSDIAAADIAGVTKLIGDAPGTDWIRVVGYHESMDQRALDKLSANRPIRLQHASGKMWVLNSLALERLGVADMQHPGVERDVAGRPTGRLFRMDDALRDSLVSEELESTAQYSRELASVGITSFTDASYTNSQSSLARFEQAAASGDLLQRYYLMGDESLAQGHLKIMLDEDRLPDVDELAVRIATAHKLGRPVAAHCVSRVELLVYLTALSSVGVHPLDRVEHGSMIADDLLPLIAQTGVCVVTQPGFVGARGDRYISQVPKGEQSQLYRFASLLRSGISVAASSDAPYGPVSPWQVIASAMDRETPSGAVLGAAECVDAKSAIAGYLSEPNDPRSNPRHLEVGQPADMCLLDCELKQAFAGPNNVRVSQAYIGGQLVFDRSANTSSECSPQ